MTYSPNNIQSSLSLATADAKENWHRTTHGLNANMTAHTHSTKFMRGYLKYRGTPAKLSKYIVWTFFAALTRFSLKCFLHKIIASKRNLVKDDSFFRWSRLLMALFYIFIYAKYCPKCACYLHQLVCVTVGHIKPVGTVLKLFPC